MSYQGKLYDIIWLENGHCLLKSYSRKDVFHSVDVHEGTCSCESAHFNKVKCGHLIFLETVSEAIKELKAKDQEIKKTFLFPTEENVD